MQVAGSAYPATQPLYPYPNHYHHHHHPIPVAHDHELKRQYLTLLPPQQIIDICLTFDVHVPPYVKASIWPIDINAAIAGLRKPSAASSSSKQSQDAEPAVKTPFPTIEEDSGGGGANEGAIMGSLTSGSGEPIPVPDPTQTKSQQNVEEPRPPDKDVPTQESNDTGESNEISGSTISATSTAGAPSTTDSETPLTSPTSSVSTSTPAPTTNEPPESSATAAAAPPTATPAIPAQPIPVAYPHQPYGYPYAPYYPPPPPGYPYPHHQYPAYPHQTQHTYPPPPPPTSMPPVPPPPAPPMQMMQEGQSADDLPSYEEMIVEALMDSNDPEGCAPKDLFTWMAARYPVQSNFRPSASQALQKAYKRGRLEKSSNNKYRLNAAWEGGNTSRRTTRRPQTHTHTLVPNNPAPSSPFTNAPLIHHHQQQQQHQAHQQPHPQHQPYPYASYPYPQGAYSGYSQQPQAPIPTTTTPAAPETTVQPSATAPTASTSGPKSPATGPVQDKEANDAYEAAQNILKAINFGSLLQLPPDETQEAVAARGSWTSDPSQVSYQQISAAAPPQTLLAALNGARAVATPPVPTPANAAAQPSNSRADLQAQLALLAAQLAELARVDDGPSTAEPSVEIPEAPHPVQAQHAQIISPVGSQHGVEQQRSFHQAVAQQPMFNSLYPYPHLQQFRAQTQVRPPVQAQAPIQAQPTQPAVDNSAPMASLFPPPPPPSASPVPEPQAATEMPMQAPSLMQVIQSQTFSLHEHQQTPGATQHGQESPSVSASPTGPPAPAVLVNDHAKMNGDITMNGVVHEQTAIPDGLAPLESMDTELDAEYDSDDDDDMEEVV